MSKETAVIALGIWVIIVPQLGIPLPWRTTLLVLSGIALIIIGLYLRAEAQGRTPKQGERPFVESQPEVTSTQEDSVEPHERKDGITSLN
jgi:hypothetical protein